MPLNIKDESVHEAAKQLAQLTGQSITNAVRFAIMEQLQKAEARASDPKTPTSPDEITAASILALGRECAAGMQKNKERHSSDHAELLYGADGLPSS